MSTLRKFLRGFVFAARGIYFCFRGQLNFRVQWCIACGVIVAGFYFQISATDWCLVLLCIALVLSLELMNSAAEHLVDLVTSEWKPAAGKIKDMAAGSVLVSSIIAAVVGVIVFSKYFF